MCADNDDWREEPIESFKENSGLLQKKCSKNEGRKKKVLMLFLIKRVVEPDLPQERIFCTQVIVTSQKSLWAFSETAGARSTKYNM